MNNSTVLSEDSFPKVYDISKAEDPLTCWRIFERLPGLQNSAVHIRWRPYARKEEIHQRLHVCGQGQRFGFWGQVHHG